MPSDEKAVQQLMLKLLLVWYITINAVMLVNKMYSKVIQRLVESEHHTLILGVYIWVFLFALFIHRQREDNCCVVSSTHHNYALRCAVLLSLWSKFRVLILICNILGVIIRVTCRGSLHQDYSWCRHNYYGSRFGSTLSNLIWNCAMS